MNTSPSLNRPRMQATALAASLALVSALAGCGGGGSSADTAAEASASAAALASASADNSTVTQLAADAAQTSTDLPAVIDASVTAAEALNAQAPAVAETAETAEATRSTAAAATVSPGAATSITVPLPCAVSGQAVLTISGAPRAVLLNGQLDAGEHYVLIYSHCQTQAGQAVLNGSLELDVVAWSTTSQKLNWTARELSGTVPLGQLLINGTAAREASTSVAGDGATLRHSHATATALSLQSTLNGQVRSSTVDTLDLQRDSRWVNDLPTTAQVSGQLQFTQQRSTGSLTLGLSLQGSVNVGSDGQPASGDWRLTWPNTGVELVLDQGQAVISIDQGLDGTVDRQITLPLGRLLAAAG